MMNIYKLDAFKNHVVSIDKLSKIYDGLIEIIEKYIVNID